MANVTILGGGTWGIALAVLLDKNGHTVKVWSALESEIKALSETHTHKGLPGLTLSDRITYTLDDKEAVEGQDLLVMAVASTFTRGTAKRLSPLVSKDQKICCVAKGIEEETLMTIAVIAAFILGEYPESCMVVLLFRLGEFIEDKAVENSNKNNNTSLILW